MESSTFDAFARELLAIGVTKEASAPPDYRMTKVAAGMLFPRLRKLASGLPDAVTHGLEIGGLGILAAPAVKHLMHPQKPVDEKSTAKHELAGLGTLAIPSAYALGRHAIQHFRR